MESEFELIWIDFLTARSEVFAEDLRQLPFQLLTQGSLFVQLGFQLINVLFGVRIDDCFLDPIRLTVLALTAHDFLQKNTSSSLMPVLDSDTISWAEPFAGRSLPATG